MLKSANKTETNTYTLEVSISGEDFKAAILKAYKEQEEEGFSSNERDGIMGYEIPHHYTFLS